MKLLGIIAEYNPFHNGHQWQLEQAKAAANCSHTIAVMSGHFTQRGEPTFFDKWTRAEMAVRGGIDLVIELPTIFATRSAQYFAQGGVQLLSRLHINYLSFGAESNDLYQLQTAAESIDQPETIHILLTYLKSGCSYARALALALQKNCNVTLPAFTPNNILALEYLRAMKQYDCSIEPIIIKRHIAQHSDRTIDSSIASAKAIREHILHHRSNLQVSHTMPPTSVDIIQNALNCGKGPITISPFSNIILANLRTATLEELAKIPDISEGLHYKLYSSAQQAVDLAELLEKLQSKRYPLTRLQRMLIHILLKSYLADITTLCNLGPLYARVLAFNSKGRMILKDLQTRASIPSITKTTHFLSTDIRQRYHLSPLQKMLAIDTLASDIYSLGFPNKKFRQGGLDFRKSPVYVS